MPLITRQNFHIVTPLRTAFRRSGAYARYQWRVRHTSHEAAQAAVSGFALVMFFLPSTVTPLALNRVVPSLSLIHVAFSPESPAIELAGARIGSLFCRIEFGFLMMLAVRVSAMTQKVMAMAYSIKVRSMRLSASISQLTIFGQLYIKGIPATTDLMGVGKIIVPWVDGLK